MNLARPVRRGIGPDLADLAAVFRARGLDAALGEYRALRRERTSTGLALRAVEAVVPLDHICAELLRFGERVREAGVGPACREALDRWGLHPRYEVAAGAWQVLAGQPFLAFGNHAAGIEAAMFHALLDRPDVYHLAGNFVPLASPGIAEVVLPLHHTTGAEAGPATLRDRMLTSAEQAIWPSRSDFAAQRENLAVLRRASALITDRGAGVHVFPAGSMRPGAPWQRGVGHLVTRLARHRAASSVSLLPVVYGLTDAHLAGSLLFGRRPLVRMAARLSYALASGPPLIYVPEPVPVDRLGLRPGASSREATGALLALWSDARAAASRMVPSWRAAPALLRINQRAVRVLPGELAGHDRGRS